MVSAPTRDFSARLLGWYERHGRKNLPWQQPATPYRVWVSEIMLQQTQVATVIPYFERFIKRFPDALSLAGAELDDVLRHWSGLGYYARARNMHKAAVLIRETHAGELPQDIDALTALPGIGRSTAGAILSLASGKREPILDGNVKRVLARHCAIDGWSSAATRKLWELAEHFTPHDRVANYTQAIMDLGATVCLRRSPRCDVCPVSECCVARQQGRQHELPTRKPGKPLPVRETFMLMAVNDVGEVLLERRPPQGIWGGLLSFPELADEKECVDWCERSVGVPPERLECWPQVTHSFTHFQLRITPVRIGAARKDLVMDGDRWVWYNVASPQGGLAAPVERLLSRLMSDEARRRTRAARPNEVEENV
ncbi:MAG: A/G-specific adenine glycosylase [Gammaproteobacteria bacterium]